MLCLILIVGDLLTMTEQHDRSEALFYYFRLEDQVPDQEHHPVLWPVLPTAQPAQPFGKGIWEPGTPWSGVNWVADAKVSRLGTPDVDLIPILTCDTKPIVETYHRLS
jgi:hypothetical protein